MYIQVSGSGCVKVPTAFCIFPNPVNECYAIACNIRVQDQDKAPVMGLQLQNLPVLFLMRSYVQSSTFLVTNRHPTLICPKLNLTQPNSNLTNFTRAVWIQMSRRKYD
jgi:hypothetical protein